MIRLLNRRVFFWLISVAIGICSRHTLAAFPVTAHSDAGGIHVENGIVAVDFQLVKKFVVASFAAKTSNGDWREVCASFRPDFKANPGGNKLFDTTVNRRRYQLSELVGGPAIVKNSPQEVLVRLAGAGGGAAGCDLGFGRNLLPLFNAAGLP